jgi:hypothetical protein
MAGALDQACGPLSAGIDPSLDAALGVVGDEEGVDL